MRVAFLTYPSAFQNIGGGEILLLKMKEYLEKNGVEVRLFDSWKDKVTDFDLIHVFGSVKDCLGLIRVAKARNVKVAISPILWSDFRRALFTDGPLKTKVDLFCRHAAKVVWPSFPSARRRMLIESDLVFPNSEIEKNQVSRLFAVPKEKMCVVYNGVDPLFLSAAPDLFYERFGREPFILGVGRIEPRKNQLNLIKAVKKLNGKRLVLIGSPVSGTKNYFEACRREGEGFVTFVPTLSHDDELLRSAYAACDLFVLQGWFETPGLVALEAALAGAKVIATSGGSTREYFQDKLDYINPADPKDISEKILKNLSSPKDSALKDHILNNFTWDKIARDTRHAYEGLLKCSH